MVIIRQKDGNKNSHQAAGSWRTVPSSRPQLATSGGRPTPRNDSVLSRPSKLATLSGMAVRKG